MHHLCLAVAGAAAAALLLVPVLGERPQQRAARVVAMPPIAVSPQRVAPRALGVQASALETDYQHAASLADFVKRAKRNITQGGALYALRALAQCEAVWMQARRHLPPPQADGTQPNPAPGVQLVAGDAPLDLRAAERCAGLDPARIEAHRIDLRYRLNHAHDPLLARYCGPHSGAAVEPAVCDFGAAGASRSKPLI